jgi:RNA polymerase sigma-70 factor (ECF subfamily)
LHDLVLLITLWSAAMNPLTSVQDAMMGAIPQLRAFAMKLCRNPDQADDLVQETIASGCKNIARFEPGTNMIAWLTTILRNHFLSECRRASYRLADPIDDYADTLAIPATQLASIETEELRSALIQLPSLERLALELVLGGGYSYEEAAEACGCPVGTIKSRVNRSRRKISLLLLGQQDLPAAKEHCDSRRRALTTR